MIATFLYNKSYIHKINRRLLKNPLGYLCSQDPPGSIDTIETQFYLSPHGSDVRQKFNTCLQVTNKEKTFF